MTWHQTLLAVLFIIAGIIHFVKPKFYLKIMPDYIPLHKEMVFLSGITEVVSGFLLLFPSLQHWGALLIILQLIAFFPVHIHMFFDKKKAMGLPDWGLWVRLALQFVMIYWASQYSSFTFF